MVLVYQLYRVYDLDQQIQNEVKHVNEDYQGRGVYYSSKPKDEVDYSLCHAKQSNLLFFYQSCL